MSSEPCGNKVQMPKRLIPTSTITEFLEDCKPENMFVEVDGMNVKVGEWLSIPFHRRWMLLIYRSAIQIHKRKRTAK